MIIPYTKLTPEALHGLLEEAVTRDGTELTDAEAKIQQAMDLLRRGRLVITYDLETRTCNLAPAETARDEGEG